MPLLVLEIRSKDGSAAVVQRLDTRTRSEFVIGRDNEADLVLAGSLVSRRHAIIMVESGGILVRDLKSRNGLTLEGMPIRQAVWQPGQRLGIGGFEISYTYRQDRDPRGRSARLTAQHTPVGEHRSLSRDLQTARLRIVAVVASVISFVLLTVLLVRMFILPPSGGDGRYQPTVSRDAPNNGGTTSRSSRSPPPRTEAPAARLPRTEAQSRSSTRSSSETRRSNSSSSSNDNDFAGCFLTTACVGMLGLSDDCFELRTLRRFRDTYMHCSPQGRSDIATYYQLAPAVLDALPSEDRRSELVRLYWLFILPAAILAWFGFNRSTYRIYRAGMRSIMTRVGLT